MHLSFVYISSFGVLKNVGLSFDHRYSFKVNGDTLHIGWNTSLPENFWGNGIYSLTAIVGNNGSGKTTAMRLMKRLFVEGSPRDEDVEVLIAYEMEGDICIYNHTDLKVVPEDGLGVHSTNSRGTFETLYYSGHFQPYTGAEGEMQLTGSYEASDAWLLVKDLQDYANVDTLHLGEPLYNHLAAYYAQNHYRICEILSLNGIEDLLMSVRLPQYIQFAPNRGGWNSIKLNRFMRSDEIDLSGEHWTSKTIKEQAFERFVYYGIINLIAVRKGEPDVLLALLKEWVGMPKDDGTLKTLKRIIDDGQMKAETQTSLRALHYVTDRMAAICEFDEKTGAFFVNIKRDKERLRLLMDEVLGSQYFLTARFFDILYTHCPGMDTTLSSGEQELLNLLSRLYYGITLAPQKFSNLESPRLLLLDEAEIGFHPEWQRQYVKILTEFMGFMRVTNGVDFQIVITSHSPIILSDMPVCCVNFLRREGGVVKAVTDEKETFGENVFNLYRRAFFMEDGLIGEFARIKLDGVQKSIEERKVTEDTRRQIEMIGDERIKGYFLKQLSIIDVDAEIKYHESRLRELRVRKEKRDE